VEIVDLTTPPERHNNYGTLQTKLVHHQEPSMPTILDTFEDIINDRIRIALLDIDCQEAAFMETAEQFEDKQRQMEHKQSDDRPKILQRMVQQEKLLHCWTVFLVNREDTYDGLETGVHHNAASCGFL
jgi:hypothetical protein